MRDDFARRLAPDVEVVDQPRSQPDRGEGGGDRDDAAPRQHPQATTGEHDRSRTNLADDLQANVAGRPIAGDGRVVQRSAEDAEGEQQRYEEISVVRRE